ncbi:biotin--[acetyl-CoA-carboxylase] ligase, partial [Chloroflexota bacterium]
MDESLLPSAITGGLGTRLIGRRVIYYPSLESTMAAAKQEARRGAETGTVIVAGEQTVGRGRRQRTWLSPRGSIALSIILYPGIAHLPFLVMLASLAVADSIEAVTGLKAQLKWPNDVLIDGRKVCGILVESELKGNRLEYAAIGIGLNANVRLADFPGISSVATSLADELGREAPYLELIRRLLVRNNFRTHRPAG